MAPHVFHIYVVRFPRIIREGNIIILQCTANKSVLKVYGESGKFQEDEQAVEMMVKAQPNSKLPTATQGFHETTSLF